MTSYNDPGMLWVSVTSHRGRDQLRLVSGPLGDGYGRWPPDGVPSGEYYQIACPKDMTALNRIKGLRVLRRAPANLFRRWLSFGSSITKVNDLHLAEGGGHSGY
jgi:hypothetical protein